MDTFSHVPPGFRFHPTDEELVDYYLRKKVASKKIDLDVIKDVDLYKIEPWDLQDKCKMGVEEQSDWYFFSHKDKKYPTGSRTNRATSAGFWKATGRDKPIYTTNSSCLVGMRKTLVFYKGRAPNGLKSDWIMHEYRLETNENGPTPEEGWVVCRVFKKRVPATTVQRMGDSSPCWFDDHGVGGGSFIPELDWPRHQLGQHHHQNMAAYHGQVQHHQQQLYHCKPELEYHQLLPHEAFLQQLPQLESPRNISYIGHGHGSSSLLLSSTTLAHDGASRSLTTQQHPPVDQAVYMAACDDASATDWRLLDKFVASQLFSHGDPIGDTAPKESSYAIPAAAQVLQAENKHKEALDYGSTSAGSGQR